MAQTLVDSVCFARSGNRGSDPRPLGPTMGGRLDRTLGATPCIKKCVPVLRSDQSNSSQLALLPEEASAAGRRKRSDGCSVAQGMPATNL
jgi:hypothetical protein